MTSLPSAGREKAKGTDSLLEDKDQRTRKKGANRGLEGEGWQDGGANISGNSVFGCTCVEANLLRSSGKHSLLSAQNIVRVWKMLIGQIMIVHSCGLLLGTRLGGSDALRDDDDCISVFRFTSKLPFRFNATQ